MDIIAFCKDWHEPKTSNNHVMEELAKRHRVLWVNSISTRAPNLGSANDIGKIVRKVRSWLHGIHVIHERLRVLTPIVLPFPSSPAAVYLNRLLLRWSVRREAHRWGFRAPQLWIFPPNAVDYVGQFGESKVVYYCVDEWAQFTHLNATFIRQKETELLEKADAVFVVSQKLLADKRPHNPNTHLIPHGVNWEMWAQGYEVPQDLARIRAGGSGQPPTSGSPTPPTALVGFYGNLYDWVDQELLVGIAQARPAWQIVLIGKLMTDLARLRACPNIHLLGPRPYQQLPAYCRGFDVGLIPYRRSDPRMQSVNPLKLREYLAAGLPVVAVDLPEVRVLGGYVRLAEGPEQFVEQIEQALATNNPAQQRERQASVAGESWAARVATIQSILAGDMTP